MKLFTRKIHLFCVSNIMVSFVCTGLLSINGYANVIGSTTDEAHEISLTASDTEPVSQNGEGEESKYAFIAKGIDAVIYQQEKVLAEKATSTKKQTNKKKTTSVVTKKEVATTYSYTKPSYSSVTGDAIVSFAKQFMGLKYVHAGRSLKTGTDCSGFTMLIYREFGVSLPPTVGGQINKGKYVAKKDLQKGDLVFYKAKGSSGGASHVGIYIGGGQVIHESRPGVGVKISPVNMMQYVTARRVINSNSIKIAEQKLAEQNSTPTPTPVPSNNTNNESGNNTVVENNNTTTNNDNNSTGNDTGNTNTSTSTETPAATPVPTPVPTPVATPKPETPSTPPETNEESTSTEGSN